MLQIDLWKRISIWLVVVIGVFYASPNLFYSTVERSNDAEIILAEGTVDEALQAQADEWPSWAPDGLVNLGLDLRGGAHLLVEVQVTDVYAQRMESLWPEVRDVLFAQQASIGGILRDTNAPEDQLRVQIRNPEAMDEALTLVRGLARPIVSLSGAGASDLSVSSDGNFIVVELSEAEKLATDDRTMRQSLEIIRRRIDEVGTREPNIQRIGADRILVQVPGVGSAQEVKIIIGTTAQLTFQPVISVTNSADAVAGAGNEVLPDVSGDGTYYILEKRPVVTGEDLTDARPEFDRNGSPAVGFQFNPTGARKFGVHTTENRGALFAIVLDGEVVSAPRINEPITGGSGIITGNFSVEESTNLAVLLRAGALPAELNFLEERTIGPDLGQDSIDAGTLACIVAFAAVLVFMVLSYGVFGLFANIALIINVTLIFALLSIIGATLTLPGIAGIVLTIGMAVDANVLVFERIREEQKNAKGAARAIDRGYEKALSAIVDANITTMITALILLFMGSGAVQGFAWTLMFGIMTSVFTAIYVTRLLVVIYFERRRPKTVLMGRALRLVPKDTKWDFFRRWKMSIGASILLMVVSIGSFATQGLNYGIDFKGGTTIRSVSTEALDVGAYRAALGALDLGDISITEVSDVTFAADENVALITIQAQDGDESVQGDLIASVEQALSAIDPGLQLPFSSVESVGPTVSGELIWTAMIAVGLAVGAVLVYIWLRFEWQFALGAVAALVHDVVLTIGVFSILRIQFDQAIIAALLTIVGYSLNDTVVVFDRVRENLRKYKKLPLGEVLNLSINETLSRTVMTSVTTLLALLALYVLGGDVIRGFVFAMIWGVIVGTYSSVFVASGILLRLGVKRDWSKQATTGNQFANIDA